MATLSAPRTTSPRNSPTSSATLRDWLGFHPAAIPIIAIIGTAYLMVSLPSLFGILAGVDLGPAYVHRSLAFLWDQAQRWESLTRDVSYNSFGIWAIRLSLFAIPALWVASLVRSMIVKSWRPFVITFSASLLAAIGIPMASWIGEAVVVLWRVLDTVITWFATYILPWLLRILLWGFIVFLAGAALYGLYTFVRFLTEERKWLAFLAVAGVVGLLVGAGWLGWLDWLFDALAWLFGWIEKIIDWIVALLTPILRWIARAVIAIIIFVFVVGLAVGFLGEAGRQIFLPLRSAARAGNDQGRCADLTAGVGIAMSLALTAAVLDPRFSSVFARVWQDTPLIRAAPLPVDAYNFLLPGAAEDILRPAFVGYLPIIDVGLLVFAAVVGVLSLLFAPAHWASGRGSRVVRPVLLAVGGAIAFGVVVLALMLVIGTLSDALGGG